MEKSRFISDGKIINVWCKSKYFDKHATEEEKIWMSSLLGDTIAEKLFLFYHACSRPCCPVCKKPLKFKSFDLGYYEYCSTSCKSRNQVRSDETKRKTAETLKKTMLERYGVENYWQTEESRSLPRDFSKRQPRTKQQYAEEAKKRAATNLSRYGNVCSLHGTNHDRTTAVLEEKYGANGVQKMANETASNNRWTKHHEALEKYCIDNNIEIVNFTIKNSKNFFKCKICGEEFHRVNGFPVCPRCNKPNIFISKKEKEILEYIKSIYDGPIRDNDRKLLSGKELDVYLPDLKLAFEYNGTFWHGYSKCTKVSLAEFKRKIEEKRLLCRDLGVRLITIDECDYIDRPEVFKRFISNVILPKRRVNARDCELRKIDTKTARDFLEYYHVNGFRGGETKLGLYEGDELLSVAVFGKHKKENECIRLCFKTGVEIVGGWAKLRAHFGQPFFHFVNLKYFEGENKTGVGWRFVINGKVLYRAALQKRTGLFRHCNVIYPGISDFQTCILNDGVAVFDLGNDIRLYD